MPPSSLQQGHPTAAGRSRLHPTPRAQRFRRPTRIPSEPIAARRRQPDSPIFFLGARSQSCPRCGLPLANGKAEPVATLPLRVLLEAPPSGLVSQSVLQLQRRTCIAFCRGAFLASVDSPVTRAQQAEMFWLVATVGVAVAVVFLLLLSYVVSPVASPKPLSLSGAHVVVRTGQLLLRRGGWSWEEGRGCPLLNAFISSNRHLSFSRRMQDWDKRVLKGF